MQTYIHFNRKDSCEDRGINIPVDSVQHGVQVLEAYGIELMGVDTEIYTVYGFAGGSTEMHYADIVLEILKKNS